MPRPIPPDMPASMTGPPVSTPSHGQGGYFTVACSGHIAASPQTCLDVVREADQYPDWNRFCRKCTIENPGEPPVRLNEGSQFIFDVHLDPDAADGGGRDTALEVSFLEPIDEPGGDDGGAAARKGWRIVWKTRGMPGWLLRSERVQEFVEVPVQGGSPGEMKTEYLCWETFYGLLAVVVKAMVGSQIVRGFQVWSDDLRKQAESVERGGQRSS